MYLKVIESEGKRWMKMFLWQVKIFFLITPPSKQGPFFGKPLCWIPFFPLCAPLRHWQHPTMASLKTGRRETNLALCGFMAVASRDKRRKQINLAFRSLNHYLESRIKVNLQRTFCCHFEKVIEQRGVKIQWLC